MSSNNNDSIFTSRSLLNTTNAKSPENDKKFLGRKNTQSRSFLKEPEPLQNPRHLSMISLSLNKNERKKTIESGTFLDSSNNTIKSKALEDIMEDPLLEDQNGNGFFQKGQKEQSSPKVFERSYQIHPSISTFKSETSQLLQPPNISKGDYESSSASYTRINLVKTETENSILPSFIDLKSGTSNFGKEKDVGIRRNSKALNIPVYGKKQNSVSSISSNEKKNVEMFMPMDACGEFEIYLPHNNFNHVVENLTKSKHLIQTLSMTSRIMKIKDEVESPSPIPGSVVKKKK